MSIHINTNYYQDELEKRFCHSCKLEFIVGRELAEGKDIACPYCGMKDNEAIVWMDDVVGLGELGCIGIYFRKKNGKYYSTEY